MTIRLKTKTADYKNVDSNIFNPSLDGGNLENVSYDCSFKYVGTKCNFKIIFFHCEAIRLETRMPDNPFFAEYVIGIYNFLEIESSLLESIQDLNFRLGIQAKD